MKSSKTSQNRITWFDFQGQTAKDVAQSTDNLELAKKLDIKRYEQNLDIRHPFQAFTTNKVSVLSNNDDDDSNDNTNNNDNDNKKHSENADTFTFVILTLCQSQESLCHLMSLVVLYLGTRYDVYGGNSLWYMTICCFLWPVSLIGHKRVEIHCRKVNREYYEELMDITSLWLWPLTQGHQFQ